LNTENVTFYSDGVKIAGLYHTPDKDSIAPPWPALVQGPGWLGLKDSKLYRTYHERFIGAGYSVLVFDYRGFGDSEGERGILLPEWQARDIRNAITYAQTRTDVDPNRIGLFGSGGTGGGNAVYVAGIDERVKCAVCYHGVANGRDWLRSMRREYEWVEFLQRIEADRKNRVLTGESEMVLPRQEIMVATPERKQTKVKADVEARIPDRIQLRSADAILDYCPEDVVDRISPRAIMFIAVPNDVVTPEEQTYRMYQKAKPPKKLIILHETTHYRAYSDYLEEVSGEVIDWYNRYLKYSKLERFEE